MNDAVSLFDAVNSKVRIIATTGTSYMKGEYLDSILILLGLIMKQRSLVEVAKPYHSFKNHTIHTCIILLMMFLKAHTNNWRRKNRLLIETSNYPSSSFMDLNESRLQDDSSIIQI